MDIQEALAERAIYNKMIDCPSQGILGLELYKNKRVEYKDEIVRDLQICQKYCDVFISVIDDKEVKPEDIFIYAGIVKVFQDPASLKGWRDKMATIYKTIEDIQRKLPDIEDFDETSLENSISYLIDLRTLCESHLSKHESESVISGIVMR